jgi:hypothetical protein
MLPDEERLSWTLETGDDWRAKVNAWDWKARTADEWIKEGSCPRCGHGMTVHAEAGVLSFQVSRREPQPVLARCNCSIDHPGHPSGDYQWGCGQSATIDPPG